MTLSERTVFAKRIGVESLRLFAGNSNNKETRLGRPKDEEVDRATQLGLKSRAQGEKNCFVLALHTGWKFPDIRSRRKKGREERSDKVDSVTGQLNQRQRMPGSEQ